MHTYIERTNNKGEMIFVVGHYDPKYGYFNEMVEYKTRDDATQAVSYLNGGTARWR
jgi:hypothetical protein